LSPSPFAGCDGARYNGSGSTNVKPGKIVTLTNTDITDLREQVQHHLARRNLAGAQQACLNALTTDRDNSEAHYLLGIVSAELGKFVNAAEFIEKAITLDDSQADYHAHLARCLSLLNRDTEAQTAVDRAIKLDPPDPLTLDTIGVVCSRLGDHDRAIDVFRRAAAKQPTNPGFQFNLGSSLKFLGAFDEAEDAYESAIAANPKLYKVHSALSHLRRQAPDRNHIDRLEGLLKTVGENVDGELYLRHSLAKEYDDTGHHDKAFEHLSAGNRRRRRTLNYDIEYDRKLFECVEALFSEDAIRSARPGHGTEEPIFVVGMPRTGTTLTERILTSHSSVFSAGELKNFSLSLKRASGSRSNVVLDTETLRQGMEVDFESLGKSYLDSTRPATGHTPHFTDKLPLNFLYIGFIHLALPDAKIICLRRNPLDTCLSNFRQLFDVNFSYYNYAYDIMETGRYYVLFHRLMEHWQRVLPGKILEVHYENLVADQETESRRIVEHCGLEWEEACLAFEKNTAAVATASAVQVRERIYTTAVGRWRRYEAQLQPLRDMLESENMPID
jgi:tetratricopeptide (TPR) repeat protein